MRTGTFAGAFLVSCVASVAALVAPRATVCNGHADLCSRSYGNTSYLGSHDSFAISGDILALARTQEVSLTDQLNLGVRMLQAQSHMDDGELKFCHTSCLLFDGGLVVNYLKTVKSWLDANPNEVLTFIFTNPEELSLTTIWQPVFEASGIASIAYIPPSTPVARGAWPTLGSLIDSGKRVLIFFDNTAGGGLNYVMPEFDMIWEPPFSETDDSFPCRVDRISGSLSTAQHMSMLNHNLNIELFGSILIPDYGSARETNSMPSILANSNGCASLAGGVAANFVMLDFVNIGEGWLRSIV
ncbi:PLC-like phosphodiesterase [Mucidula mucida]|nr:PLC-like phosphodiesterase [Mucidula mucida]